MAHAVAPAPLPAAGWAAVEACDPEIAALLADEARRQDEGLELIASENYASPAVLATCGSVLTNKYAEGPVGRRYYGGCQVVDRVEALGARRACELFGAEYANLQPHSGTQANMAVLMAFLDPGDSILAMDLAAGGHLTHGARVNFSGRLYRQIPYGVDARSGRIDMDAVAALAEAHRPKMVIAGASAYPRTLDFARFGEIARAVGAIFLADIAHIAGLVAGGAHPSPLPHADVVTTTTHKTLRGPRGGLILARASLARKLDQAVCPRVQGGPLMHVVAAKALALAEARGPGFRAYQRQIVANARALAEGLLARGFRLVGGGTDNHLVLVDLDPQGMTGQEAEAALGEVGITVNKNQIPFDRHKPTVTGGIRLGTPALTTRGMRETEMREVAELVADTLAGPRGAAPTALPLAARVRALTARFPTAGAGPA